MNYYQIAVTGKGFVHTISLAEKDKIMEQSDSLYKRLMQSFTPESLQALWDSGFYVELADGSDSPFFTIKSKNEKLS
jgi:hypothetical protein